MSPACTARAQVSYTNQSAQVCMRVSYSGSRRSRHATNPPLENDPSANRTCSWGPWVGEYSPSSGVGHRSKEGGGSLGRCCVHSYCCRHPDDHPYDQKTKLRYDDLVRCTFLGNRSSE
eukprot:9482885-Pyramimonas_sp.AAC.2